MGIITKNSQNISSTESPERLFWSNISVCCLSIQLFSRVDVAANTATKTIHHHQLPPLGIAIMLGRIDLWKMLREHIELTDEAKTEQLFYMISETEDRSFPLEEFKELLESLPVDKVD